jgi:ubiquinone/menaquinone biosynthesis C-methylase UbiE
MTLEGFFPGTFMADAGWWEARVLADVVLKPGMTVVDLCSGDGWFTLQIAKVAKHVTAIDIDVALLETAKARLWEANISNCAFIEADAFDLARCVGEPVDHVFLGNALHGVPDKRRLAAAVHA